MKRPIEWKNTFFISASIAIIAILHCQRIATQQSSISVFPTDPLLLNIDSDSIILRWDKPVDTTLKVTGYELSYRVHGSTGWKILNNQISAKDSPWVMIYRNNIDNVVDSLFDFAVQALFMSGDTSDMNISIDSLTSPRGGWFVTW